MAQGQPEQIHGSVSVEQDAIGEAERKLTPGYRNIRREQRSYGRNLVRAGGMKDE